MAGGLDRLESLLHLEGPPLERLERIDSAMDRFRHAWFCALTLAYSLLACASIASAQALRTSAVCRRASHATLLRLSLADAVKRAGQQSGRPDRGPRGGLRRARAGALGDVLPHLSETCGNRNSWSGRGALHGLCGDSC
jgi:hypothetical protein